MYYLLSGLLLALVSNSGFAAPVGWADRTQECAERVNKWIDSKVAEDPSNAELYRKDLYLTKADGGSISFGVKGAEFGASFPGIGLNKTRMPGAGYCCTLDQNMKIVDAKMVLHGNDECWDHMRVLKNAANKTNRSLLNQKWHGMLRWCTGPQQNCFIDNWYEYHVK